MNPLPWYHKTAIYQIYPRSFYDSNGDGIGDLRGIIHKLNYIKSLGFETIWISPFFSSPQADLGYDVSNYTDIAPEYGTMDDALQLIEEVHKLGMRILFDLVMNHTSIEHPWFKESRSSRDNPKADWHIWRDPPRAKGEGLGVRGKPNNWLRVTGGSGWHYAAERDQYFWTTFLPFQPDLNYRNPQVKQAIFDIIRFWLTKGVDGFRLDLFNYIYKDEQFRDNPFSWKLLPSADDYSAFFQEPKYTVNLPESFEFAKEVRSFCEEFGDKLLIGEANGGTNIIRRFLGDETNNGLTLVFDFRMQTFKFTADYFHQLIQDMERAYPPPFMPVYVFSNHDRVRSIKRLGNDVRKAKLLHMLQLTVRGVPCMYYGEEIGMTDAKFPFAKALDPVARNLKFIPRWLTESLGIKINRDEVRTPMQWNTTKNAGFSHAEKTWLPVHENYRQINVDTESKDENSLLNAIRGVTKIRNHEPALQEGSIELIEGLPKNVLGYTRSFKGERISILLNFDDQEKEFSIDVAKCIFKLSTKEQLNDKTLKLSGYGGVILKQHMSL